MSRNVLKQFIPFSWLIVLFRVFYILNDFSVYLAHLLLKGRFCNFTSIGSSKKKENSRKNIYFCLTDYAKAFDCVDHNKLWEILKEMGIPPDLPLEKSVYRSGSKLEQDMEQQTGPK